MGWIQLAKGRWASAARSSCPPVVIPGAISPARATGTYRVSARGTRCRYPTLGASPVTGGPGRLPAVALLRPRLAHMRGRGHD